MHTRVYMTNIVHTSMDVCRLRVTEGGKFNQRGLEYQCVIRARGVLWQRGRDSSIISGHTFEKPSCRSYLMMIPVCRMAGIKVLTTGLPVKKPYTPILAEVIFGQMLTLPRPRLSVMSYATVMVELCKVRELGA